MTALACAVTGAGGPSSVAAGAIAFTASDISVARDRFVQPGFANRAWGLPLYYLAQVLLDLGNQPGAKQAIAKAVALGGPRLSQYLALQETVGR